MGHVAHLRLIRDRFIAGHGSCELRRYVDCALPDTPLRDIVDRCRVWESHAEPEVRRVSKSMPEPAYPAYVVNESEYETEPVRVVTMNKPNSSVDQMEELLKRLLTMLTPAVPALIKKNKDITDGQVGPTFVDGNCTAQTGPPGTGQTTRSGNDVSNVFRGTAVVATTT